MAVLTWNDSLRLGVESLDAEHRALLALLNEVLAVDGEPWSAGDGAAFVDRLFTLASEHVRHEEAVMERIGYPDLENHRRAHATLREQARFLKKVIEDEDNPALIRIELAGFLSSWMADHMAAMDMPLRPYIARHVALNGPL